VTVRFEGELIARGSFGRVLKILDPRTGEPRALKVAIATGAAEAMLLAEFEQLARLEHPSLPRVFEVGRTTEPVADVPVGAPYFITEWIAGGPSDGRAWTDPAAIWSLLADLAGALAVLHANGLVHGDVAPQNILLAGDRAMLIDLGLATGVGARGTPAFMAPEALAGHVDARGDLYSLGASVARLVLGTNPFAGTTLGTLAHAILTTPHPVLPLPAALADLIDRLYARDADRRPASALAVLDELDELAPVIAPAVARRARPAIAAPPDRASWPGAEGWIAELARALHGSRVHVVIGGVGSGARTLVESAARRWQLERAAQHSDTIGFIAGSLDDVATELGVPPTKLLAGWIDRVARTIRRRDAIVVLELAGDPRAAACIAALARSPGELSAIAIVAPDDAAEVRVTREGTDIRRVPVLDLAGVTAVATAMIGRAPPLAWAEALLAVSSGAAQTAIELVRALADEPDPFAIEWATRSTTGLADVRARQLAAISPRARRLAFAVAAFGGRAPLANVLVLLAGEIGFGEAVELERAGLARRDGARGAFGDELVLDRATVQAVEQIAAAELREVAQLALAQPALLGLDAQAALLAHVELDDVLAQRACDVADELLARGRGDRARAVALLVANVRTAASQTIAMSRTRTAPVDTRAPTLPVGNDVDALALTPPLAGPESGAAESSADTEPARSRTTTRVDPRRVATPAQIARACLIAARAAASLGAYREALDLAHHAEIAGADPIEAQLLVARTSQRAGDLDAAEAALGSLHAAHPQHAEIAGAYARLLVTRSRYEEARVVAKACGPLAGLRAEAAGLAAFYLGELDDADRAFAALEVTATAAGEDAAIGRALSLRGMVAQQRGQLGLASDRYREAAKRLGEVGEIHAAAVAELNLGTVLAERGRASEALPRLAAASRVFADLAATTEQIAADLNRGNALLAVGQAAEARNAAEQGLAQAAGAPHLRAFALLVLGDARRRLGDDTGAERSYREALAIGNERDDAHAQISAYIALAEAGHAPARSLGEVAELCASDDDRDRWAIACGRLALTTAQGDFAALAHTIAGVARRAHDADRIERAFRAHAVAALLAQRAGNPSIDAQETERARSAHAAIIAAAAPAFRAALERDPDAANFSVTAATLPAPARNDASSALLRRLLALSRRLNSEADVERILDEVIDTAIELTAAERGFLLLRQDDGELKPVVSRNFAMADLEANDRSVSRSIAERAAQSGEAVITVDAGVDERFAVAASVAALRLRSVLAVPLRQRGTVTGCIYVDHRLRGGAFDDTAASVLGELAEIAAIAIENARLTERLRRTTVEVDELNRRLAADLEERDAELVRVKAELPDRDRLRHRYERIVGRSPAMVKMLDTLDRAAAVALPVVIVGESGTGKELVARALHDHGPRKAAAFVAINCSAVPEPLLESELFGHVRGAFTGADRDRRGMFEVADGGTLFLDEIADTGMAMQAKLLRVLQDGVIRRVGEAKTRQVDVRIIAAAQRPLAELVTNGVFREDLRFRLEVITIVVPPLRERDGDIPLLVDSLLQRLAPGKPPARLTRAALRALGQHRWPGNVRELENALARGVAMGGDVLDLPDLPEAIAAAGARPEPAKPQLGEDLRLKPAIIATEQAYITAAMTRAKQNQTVAARLLGLSRFGLQKKLRRLSGEAEGSDDE
jgi:transcriptional regulator with GAF, ATPase, and Fis domain/tetratricopeptide (TPR) repeat protein